MTTTTRQIKLRPGIVVTNEFKAACCKVRGLDDDQPTITDLMNAAHSQLPAIKAEMAKLGAKIRRYDGIETLEAYYAVIADGGGWYVNYGPDER